MAGKPASSGPKWHESVPEYVDFSDKKPHIIRFEDEGDLVKIPGSKSDTNVSFLVSEKTEEGWEKNNATFSSMRALRIIKELQSEGPIKGRVFAITRTGEAMETKYEFVELGEDFKPIDSEE